MVQNVIRFLLLVLLALLVGTMFGIWVGANPSGLSATAYVEQQQNAIRSLNILLPIMGAICIILTATLALGRLKFEVRHRPAVLMLIAAIVTRFENQPINAVVIQWSPESPAVNWAELRDQWWQWHIVRSLAGIGALVLTVLAILGAKCKQAASAA